MARQVGPSSQGGNVFFTKYGGPSGGSPLSGGGIIILRVIRRHFLAAAWTQLSVSPRTVLFLGLAIIQTTALVLSARRGQRGRNDFHRTWTVRGEADSWVHGSRKEVPPYYAENNYSST